MDELTLQKRYKLIAMAFVMVCILIIICSQFMLRSLNDMYHSTIDEQLENQADQYIVLFKNKVWSDLSSLETLSGFMQFQSDSDTETIAKQIMQSKVLSKFIYIGYFTMNSNGIRVKNDGTIEENIGLDSVHFYIRDAIHFAEKGAVSFSNIYYDSELNSNVFAYAFPIYANGEIAAVFYAVQNISYFTELLHEFYSDSDALHVAMMDKNGLVLTSNFMNQSAGVAHVSEIDTLPDDTKKTLAQILKNQKGGNFDYKIDDIQYYGYVEPIGLYSIQVVLIDTHRRITGNLLPQFIITRRAGICICVIAIVFITLSVKSVYSITNKLLNAAYTDTLTGTYNKTKFIQLLQRKLVSNKNCAVIAFNVRNFKFINEIFGAKRANALLQYLSNKIDRRLQEGEFFCRDTADLFLICVNPAKLDEIIICMKRFFYQTRIKNETIYAGYPLHFYCGIAYAKDCLEEENKDQELLTHLMFALNHAKEQPFTAICCYDSMLHESEQFHNYIESNMERALQDGEFQMFLQPKISLQTGKLSGAEALVRWFIQENQQIYPDQFIPIFEENGFCVKLDLYMVEQACKQIREWMDEGLTPVPISVNQTKLLFYQEGYVEQLVEITQKYAISPNYLILEILEGLAMENLEQLNFNIDKLRQVGFQISMDDFGSGYSSLNTLSKIKIDELKLDRLFLMDVTQDEAGNQREILAAILTLAHKLNIRTVAEGIETKENEQMLMELHCDYGQGYYYSRPISAEEFREKFLLNTV